MQRNYLIVLGCALVFLFISGGYTSAGNPDNQEETAQKMKNQTLCPVMGGKIDSTVYTDIQGQRVYHCYPMCSDILKADPDKYFKKAAEEGVLFESIQTSCPVSGEPLEDKSVFSDHEGRRIYFCCKKCGGAFAENPQKFLEGMDMAADSDDGMKMEKKHEGHDHDHH